MNALLQCKPTILPLFIAGVLACFGLLPKALAVVPPPDGGYANFTTAAGDHALQALTLGLGNTAIGTFSLFSVTTGSFNTAVGALALDLNTADSNTATGAAALLFNTTGTQNTANGTAALEFNDTGDFNTATGAFALSSNTTGNFNTANGVNALLKNTTGSSNTASGDGALHNTTTGNFNTANGVSALVSNTIGNDNTANGVEALAFNTTGEGNTANGNQALENNTTGGNNTAIGARALLNSTTGNLNTALGVGAGSGVTTASNVICIRANGANVDNSCFIDNIRGVGTENNDAVPVLIDSAGQLGTISSSRRFKKQIKPMEQASETILSLKPVTFHYKRDTKGTPQFGLIAEDVAAVNPDLVVRDKNGEIYTVRYDAVNAMLLNEFLKEHRKVEDLKKDFQATVAQLTTQLREQAAQIQKVSAQLEASKPAPQVVNNP